MKKLALILAFLVIPCAAFGLEMLNDAGMDAVTGQAGVHIAMDDVQIFINIERMAYIDCDGYNSTSGYGICSGAGAGIYISNFQIDTLQINSIVSSVTTEPGETQTDTAGGSMALHSTSCGLLPLVYNYGTNAVEAGCYLTVTGNQNAGLNGYRFKTGTSTFQPSAITIDVTTQLPSITQALQERGGTLASMTFGGVMIGLPTVELYIGNLTFTPTLTGAINGATSSTAVNAVENNPASNYGTIEITGITMAILSGWLEIGPH